MSSKQELWDKIRDPGAAGTHGREAARAELDVILSSEMTDSLAQLSADIRQFQKILARRVDELSKEIAHTRDVMAQASAEASSLTSAIIKWTRLSVVAIIVYTILTAGLFLVSLFGSPWARLGGSAKQVVEPAPTPKSSAAKTGTP